MKDFRATPVPDWAAQTTGDPEDFDSHEFRIGLTGNAYALAPDAFGWWLDQQLADARKALLDAYYDQRR